MTKTTLFKICGRATENIPLSPWQDFKNLPVDLLYANVIIKTVPQHDETGRGFHKFLSDMKSKGQSFKRGVPITINGPNDLFKKYGKQTERIFMIGKAGYGKTTFCIWLLHHWYNAMKNADPNDSGEENNEWQIALREFELVFLIKIGKLKNVKESIIEILCKEILEIHDKARAKQFADVLRAGKRRSLIIIDGLDEIDPDHKTETNIMLSTDDIQNSVILITMRPWKFKDVAAQVHSDDRVVEIRGFEKDGIEELVEKICSNCPKNGKENVSHEEIHTKIMSELNFKSIQSVMEIPLIALMFIQSCYEEKSGNITQLFQNVIRMLIKHALNTSKLKSRRRNFEFCCQKVTEELSCGKSVVRKMKKLAFKKLLAGEYFFIYPSGEAEESLGFLRSDFQILLNIGILSIETAERFALKKEVRICFLHSTIQEFLGAQYIAERPNVRKSFLERLSCLEDILKYRNVLLFLSGLKPELICEMSQYIIDVAYNDSEVNEYGTLFNILLNENNKIQSHYQQLASFYRELACHFAQYEEQNENRSVIHVKDVYVDGDSDKEMIKATADILNHYNTNLRLLCLHGASSDGGCSDSHRTQSSNNNDSMQAFYIGSGSSILIKKSTCKWFSSLTALLLFNIALTSTALDALQEELDSNEIIQSLGLVNIKLDNYEAAPLSGLINILPGLKRLSTLHIFVSNKKDKDVLPDVISRLTGLQGIHYCASRKCDDCNVVQNVCALKELQWMSLDDIYLGDNSNCLQLSDEMLKLDTIVLKNVEISEAGIGHFLQSLTNLKQSLKLKVRGDNVQKFRKLIQSTTKLVIEKDDVNDQDTHELDIIHSCD